MSVSYAILADIVGSRTLADRPDAQRTFREALTQAARGLRLL